MLNYKSRETGDIITSLILTLILKLLFMVRLSLISYCLALFLSFLSWLRCGGTGRCPHDVSLPFQFEQVTT
jgi:hypothetical protein